MKKRIAALAACLALALTACGQQKEAPATVGTIGSVDIPGGVYQLAQFSAYAEADSLTSEGRKAVFSAWTGSLFNALFLDSANELVRGRVRRGWRPDKPERTGDQGHAVRQCPSFYLTRIRFSPSRIGRMTFSTRSSAATRSLNS